MNDKFIVGWFGAPHGLQGWVKVISFTEPVTNIFHYQPWFIFADGKWQALTLQEFRQHGQHLLVKLPDCEEREAASRYTRHEIAVARDQLPALKKGEYYWHDLVGLRVVNGEGLLLGTVDSLLATGANDVLVVKGERERLIPYLKQVVLEVDKVQGMIKVDWDAAY